MRHGVGRKVKERRTHALPPRQREMQRCRPRRWSTALCEGLLGLQVADCTRKCYAGLYMLGSEFERMLEPFTPV